MLSLFMQARVDLESINFRKDSQCPVNHDIFNLSLMFRPSLLVLSLFLYYWDVKMIHYMHCHGKRVWGRNIKKNYVLGDDHRWQFWGLGRNRNAMTQFSCSKSRIFHEHFGGNSEKSRLQTQKGPHRQQVPWLLSDWHLNALGCYWVAEWLCVPASVLTEGAAGLLTVVNCPWSAVTLAGE